MRTTTAREGDMIDEIVWHHYGATNGNLEATLEANPHLLGKLRLDAGDIVNLPERKPPPAEAGFRLW